MTLCADTGFATTFKPLLLQTTAHRQADLGQGGVGVVQQPCRAMRRSCGDLGGLGGDQDGPSCS